MTTYEALELLNSKINELKSVNTTSEFFAWRQSTVQRLQIICPNSPIIKQIDSLESSAIYTHDSVVPESSSKAKIMLKSLVEDLTVAGIEAYQNSQKNENRNIVNIDNSNSQSQSQEQKMSVGFELVIDCLKNELRGSEIEELKEILESEEEPKEKKKKFSEKLKSFGSDVASNILANILTNPQVYKQLGSMI